MEKEIITADQARRITNQFNIRNHELFNRAMRRINECAREGENSTIVFINDESYKYIVDDVTMELKYLGYKVNIMKYFLHIEW